MTEDSRGVLRGRCSACTCTLYTRHGSEKCAICSHPPARHLKLSHSSATGNPVPGQSQPALLLTSYQKQHVAPLSTYTPPLETYSFYARPILKECMAVGCNKEVHYDPELGPFDYCSPQCRDVHLLPIEQEKLKQDIARNKEKMTTWLSNEPPSSSHSGATKSSPSSSSHSSGSSSSISTPPADDGKKKKMIPIRKKPKETLGILLAKLPLEEFHIIGVELESPGHRELKSGNIKLLDIVTELNEDRILSIKWFEQSTRDKTRTKLTIERSSKSPLIDKFLTKVKDRCSKATHIKLIPNPVVHNIGIDFGIEAVKTTGGYAQGMIICVRDTCDSIAHLCGVSHKDELLMYSTYSTTTKDISDPKFPDSTIVTNTDFKKAAESGKYLLLALKQHIKY